MIYSYERPVAPVKPMQTILASQAEHMAPLLQTPIPMQPRSGQQVRVPASTVTAVAGALRLPAAGVQVAQVVTTKRKAAYCAQ